MNRILSILKIIVTLGAVTLLTGCAASSIDDVQLHSLGTEAAAGDREANTVAEVEPKPRADTTKVTDKEARKKATASVKKITSVSDPGSNAYKVGPLDVLAITVFKVAELSKTVQVSEAGTINYPLIGEVAAAGKTARQLEHDLTRKLGAKYLEKPQVTVMVTEHNSQRITLEGSIKKPGVYPIRGRMTLLQAIATANGMDTISDDTVLIFRSVKGKRTAARFDIAEIRSGKSDDPELQSGDVIVAGKSSFKEGMNNVLTALRFTSVFALF